MALIWFDGFEDHSTDFPSYLRYNAVGSNLSWDSAVTYQSTGRYADSKSLYLSSSYYQYFSYAVSTPGLAFAAGISIKKSSLGDPTSGYNYNGIMFESGNTADQISIGVTLTGAIKVWRGTNPTSNVLGTSSAGVVSAASWFHLGVEITRNASTGTVNVYVDGVSVLTLTGVNTGSTNITSVTVCNAGTGNFDDFYICDSASWLGEARVTPLVPNADTAQKDFTPSTGSDNYACIDEQPPNVTDYVSSSTVGAKDLYGLTDLSFTPLNILGVKLSAVATKDEITTRTIRNVLKSGSTSANGATKALSSSGKFFEDIWTTDPNTSAAWTKSGVDALQAGVEVVA